MIKTIEMIRVVSTNVRRIGYDKESCTLRVEYSKGNGVLRAKAGGQNRITATQSAYEYANIPEWLFDSLMASDSKGEFLFSMVVSQAKKFPATKVLAEQRADHGDGVIGSCAVGPVMEVLQKAKNAMAGTHYGRVLYILWVACGRPDTQSSCDPGTLGETIASKKQILFRDCKAVLAEASGKNEIDGRNIDKAIQIASERGC